MVRIRRFLCAGGEWKRIVLQHAPRGGQWRKTIPCPIGKSIPRRKREIMYRNNFRSPQMGGQPRPNMNFGNGGFGMQRPYRTPENNCCAPQQENNCCAPQPENNCCAPQQEDNCCAPQQGNNCCAPQQGNNCCAPQQEDNCCAPQQGNHCCAPQQENNCCAPQQEDNCCVPRPENNCCAPQPEDSCCMPLPENNCGCGNEEVDYGCFPSKKDPVAGMPLAMAYVPWQDFKDICSEEEAWCKGTIFAQLDLDFMARRCN